jgi:hypothetical protein
MLAQGAEKKLTRSILIENADSDAQDVYSLNFHLLTMLTQRDDDW